jgi:hypothetical protein
MMMPLRVLRLISVLKIADCDGAGFGIFVQNAAGLLVLVAVVDVLGSEVVLDDLVFNHAHPGFFNSHLGQGNARIRGSKRRATEDVIDLLL